MRMRGKSMPTIQYIQPFEVSDLQVWRLARTIYIHSVYTYMVCGTFDMIFWTLYECLPLEAFSVNLPQINRHCCIITAVDLGNAPFPGQKKWVQKRHQAPHSSPLCQILARLNNNRNKTSLFHSGEVQGNSDWAKGILALFGGALMQGQP